MCSTKQKLALHLQAMENELVSQGIHCMFQQTMRKLWYRNICKILFCVVGSRMCGRSWKYDSSLSGKEQVCGKYWKYNTSLSGNEHKPWWVVSFQLGQSFWESSSELCVCLIGLSDLKYFLWPGRVQRSDRSSIWLYCGSTQPGGLVGQVNFQSDMSDGCHRVRQDARQDTKDNDV